MEEIESIGSEAFPEHLLLSVLKLSTVVNEGLFP